MASSEGHSSLRASDGELPKYFEFIVIKYKVYSRLIAFACVSLARRLQLEASYQ